MEQIINDKAISASGIIAAALKDGIKNLSPSYFALVMATGIISIGAYLMDMQWIAYILFALNNGFIVLWVLTLLRLFWFFLLLKLI